MASSTITAFCIIVASVIQCTQAMWEEADAQNFFFNIRFTEVYCLDPDSDGFIRWEQPQDVILLQALNTKELGATKDNLGQLGAIVKVVVESQHRQNVTTQKIWAKEGTVAGKTLYVRKDPKRNSVFYCEKIGERDNVIIVNVKGRIDLQN